MFNFCFKVQETSAKPPTGLPNRMTPRAAARGTGPTGGIPAGLRPLSQYVPPSGGPPTEKTSPKRSTHRLSMHDPLNMSVHSRMNVWEQKIEHSEEELQEHLAAQQVGIFENFSGPVGIGNERASSRVGGGG